MSIWKSINRHTIHTKQVVWPGWYIIKICVLSLWISLSLTLALYFSTAIRLIKYEHVCPFHACVFLFYFFYCCFFHCLSGNLDHRTYMYVYQTEITTIATANITLKQMFVLWAILFQFTYRILVLMSLPTTSTNWYLYFSANEYDKIRTCFLSILCVRKTYFFSYFFHFCSTRFGYTYSICGDKKKPGR